MAVTGHLARTYREEVFFQNRRSNQSNAAVADWDPNAHPMKGMDYLPSVRGCRKQVLDGALIEALVFGELLAPLETQPMLTADELTILCACVSNLDFGPP